MTPDSLLAPFLHSEYSVEAVRKIRTFLGEQGAFSFSSFDNGLFPAAVVDDSDDVSGYANVWVRDNFHIACAHLGAGHAEVAVRNVRSLLAFFAKYSHRFRDVIAGRADPGNVMNRPHIRFDGVTLSELDQQWPHAQNDALGYFLWLLVRLIEENHLAPTAGELQMAALFVRYFQAIEFWQNEDSGHWEEQRKQSASSIGVVTSSLTRLRHCLANRPDLLDDCHVDEWELTLDVLDQLIGRGVETLHAIIPAECVQKDPLQARRFDAALLFLIYPLRLLEGATARTIVKDVVENLQGDCGMRRYLGDSYWCPDYKKKLSAEVRTSDFSESIGDRDKLLGRMGDEAQWCLFDPIVSCIYGDWYRKSRDPADLAQQAFYLNRSLSQMTRAHSADDSLRLPELYYIEDGVYVPNDHTPLLWSEANLLQALHAMEKSAMRQVS